MKKRKIDTMLEFEQIINYYLDNDLPFSLLEEEYDLSLKQRGFMLNRVLDYSSRIEKLQENIEGDISEDYLNLPHNLEEKTPLSHDELVSLFKERDELKKKVMGIQKSIDTSKYDILLADMDEREIEIAKDIAYRIDFEEIDKSGTDKKSINYYKDLYQKYLILTRERENFINVSLKNNEEYDNLITRLASINDELVHRNIKLANWVIRIFFKGMPLEMEDAQGYALEGLAKAINGFDVLKGTHFSSYATLVIKRTIQDNFTSLVGISWRNYLMGIDYKKYVNEYISSTGEKNVKVEDLYKSNLFGKTLSELKNCERYANIVTIPFTYLLPLDPLDSKDKKHDMLKTMDEYVEEDNYEDAYNTDLNLATSDDEVSLYAENKVLGETLCNLLDLLSDEEKKIIRMRFGFEDGTFHSMDKVAEELNVSKDKVSRVEKMVQRFLRHPLRSHLLHDFYMEKDVYEGKRNTYRGL